MICFMKCYIFQAYQSDEEFVPCKMLPMSTPPDPDSDGSDLSSTMLGSTQDPSYRPPSDAEDDDDSSSTKSYFFSQRRDFDPGAESPRADFDLSYSPLYIQDEDSLTGSEEACEDRGRFSPPKPPIGEDSGSKVEEAGVESFEGVEGNQLVAAQTQQNQPVSEKNRKLNRDNLFMEPEDHVRKRVPKTTKKSTEYAVNLFNTTMLQVSKELNFQHKDLLEISVDDLPWCLSKFFMVVSKADGTPLNASSLETIYASLARFLSTEFDPKIDIKSEVKFKIVKSNLDAAKQDSTAGGQRPGKHKTRPFKDEHILLCWQKKKLGRRYPRSLVSTVHLVLLSNLGFRANKEVCDIQNEDIIMGPVGEGGVPQWIELSERVTKTRRGKTHNIRELDPKVFPDHENPETCPVRTIMEFVRRKTPQQNQAGKPFLWGVKQSAEQDPEKQQFWYTNTRMGTHAIAKLLPNTFKAVGVDVKLEHYTATSARKTMMEGGIEAGVPAVLLSKVAGQAALGSIQHYVDGQEKSHKAMSLCLSRKAGANPGPQFKEIYNKARDEELAQRRLAVRDCNNTDEEESEEDQLTISQSRKVTTEETVEYRVSQSKKVPRYNEDKMQVRSGKQICWILVMCIFSREFLSSNLYSHSK